MRLVNHEFEEKVSTYLFKVVVVPFKPEIYGISPEPSLSGTHAAQLDDMVQGAVMLQDKGMRVFQGFGGRIRKFAMSFEFDENKLADPPKKSDQEAITSFWGIYRWPFKKYNRYSQLEGLEQTADETRTMAKALRFIDGATELGLSIDGGLGWMAGPDINHKVVERGDKVAVFGDSRFVPEPKLNLPDRIGNLFRSIALSSAPGNEEAPLAHLERMLRDAGYSGEDLENSVRMLVESEDMSLEASRPPSSDGVANWNGLTAARRNLASRLEHRPPLASNDQEGDRENGELNPLEAVSTDGEDGDDASQSDVAVTVPKAKIKTESYPLKPNDLSNAQREMLLETEWAQRAFMQSYAIAIIDNRSTFENIEKLTIARLPNRHLPILRREDFWNSLPGLNSLSLAIIPDWREVAKLPTSWVQDLRISPSQAVSGVYQILNDQIARRENIKTLHFEWLSGGEESPGLFSRNQHIIAAPLVLKAMDMVNRAESTQVLALPHVENLSLKNCWISPHILTRFGMSCRKTALQTLTLTSVSLTAPIPLNAQPGPINGHAANPHHGHQLAQQAAANNFLVNLQAFAAVPNPPAPNPPPAVTVPAPQPLDGPEWLQHTRQGSWAAIIENLTPATTLAQQRFERDIVADPPPPRRTGKLEKLIFESCGYVRLPLDFDQTILDPPEVPTQVAAISKRMTDLEPFMMKPNDHALGVIINHMDLAEKRTLENGFFLDVGWNMDAKQTILAAESVVDGIVHPGKGRFGGIIEKVPGP